MCVFDPIFFYWMIIILSFASIGLLVYLMVIFSRDEISSKTVKYQKNVMINGSDGNTIIIEDNGEAVDIIEATIDLDTATAQPDNTYVPDSSPSDSLNASPSVQDSWPSSPSFDSDSSQ